MAKRKSDKEMTRDTTEASEDDDEEPQLGEGWKEASAEKLKAREFVKVKRRGASSSSSTQASSESKLAVDLSAFTKPPAASSDNQANQSEKPTAANPFAKFLQKSGWECSECMVPNEDSATKCKACETPNPKAASGASSSAQKSSEPAYTFGVPAAQTQAPSAPASNPLAKFMQKSGWECPSCMLNNDNAQLKCKACETPNPSAPQNGDAKAKEEAPTFTFGAPAADSSASSSSSTINFSFSTSSSFGTGAVASSSSSAESSGFSFGSSASDSKPAYTFGQDNGSAPLFTFGSVAADSSSTNAFSSTSSWQFNTESQISTATTPVVSSQFVDAKKESSGEEEDSTLHSVRCKVYKLDGDWKESGTGELRLNINRNAKTARMILRMDKTNRLVLNAPVFDGMKFNQQEDKFVRFSSFSEGSPATFLLRLKGKAEASALYAEIERAIKELPGRTQ